MSQAAVWLLLSSTLLQNMWSCNILYAELLKNPFIVGTELEPRLATTFAGFIVFSVTACFTMLAGRAGVHTLQMREPP